MVVANFLLEPATQAHAQDFRQMGNFTVLDLAKLPAAERKRFDDLPKSPALPTNAELGRRAARAASVVDDAHRGRMGEAVHEVTPRAPPAFAALARGDAGADGRRAPAADRRRPRRHAAAGVRLPARDRRPRVQPRRRGARSSRIPALPDQRRDHARHRRGHRLRSRWRLRCGFCALTHGRPWTRRIGGWLAPILSTPHSAIAIGLAFLIAPSGWIVRAFSPWLTGWTLPPDVATVGDAGGIGADRSACC